MARPSVTEPPGEDQRRHGRGQPDADGRHPRAHVLHGVVDGEAGGHRAARGVDVDEDVLLGILAFEKQQLGHDQVGDLIVDRRAQEDDAVTQQARVDVEGALAARRGLDDHRDESGRIQRGVSSGPERCSGRLRLALRIPIRRRDPSL
jgi:hypothetical protein